MTAALPANARPPELRYRAIWFTLGCLLLLSILTLSLLPLDTLVTAAPFSDKVQHALAFLLLMLWFCGLLPVQRYWQAFAGLLAYGLLMEGLQWLTGYRYMEGADLLADIAGLIGGWLLARAGLGRWAERVERALLTR